MDHERPERTTWHLVSLKGLSAETVTHRKQRQQPAELPGTSMGAVELRASTPAVHHRSGAERSMRGPELVRPGHAQAARAQRALGAPCLPTWAAVPQLLDCWQEGRGCVGGRVKLDREAGSFL